MSLLALLICLLAPALGEAKASKRTGTLTIQVKGLPGGSSADVAVQGKGYSKKVTKPGRTVLKEVPLGRYSVKAKAVSVGDRQAVPVKGSFSVVISKKKRKGAVTVVYRQAPPPTFALSVTKPGDGTGTVTSTPAGIDCGSDCSESFTRGTEVTLTATAAAGSTFTGWSGSGCSGTGVCLVTMSEASSVSAGFSQITHQLSVTKTGDGTGTVSSTPAGIDCGSDCSESFAQGTEVTLTAKAAADSTFTGWSGSGCSGTGTCEVTTNELSSVSAGFSQANHELSVYKFGSGAGTVSSTPAGIDCGSDCSETFRQGTQVTLSATAASGSTFTGWSGTGCSGAGSCVVPMSEAKSVGAGFDYDPLIASTISAGTFHTCAIRQSGQAACWGSNSSGQLGNGTISPSNVPVDVQGISDAKEISAGTFHTCAIRQPGQAVCWGRNFEGQLGNGTGGEGTDSNVPVDVQGLSDAKEISAGGGNSCAIRQSGQAVCWGSNDYGQLGNGTSGGGTASNVPVDVRGLSDAKEISAGGGNSCAIRQSGQAVCWGRNFEGQLGNGTSASSSVPVNVQGLGDAGGISTGSLHSCAIRQSRQAVCWGSNDYGQLGNGTNSSSSVPVNVQGLGDAKQISDFAWHTCAIRQSGQVVCWGSNDYGQLGDGKSGEGTDSNVPVNVQGLGNATEISAGNFHSCAIRQSGQAVCWGMNVWGQLGDGTGTGSNVPVNVRPG